MFVEFVEMVQPATEAENAPGVVQTITPMWHKLLLSVFV